MLRGDTALSHVCVLSRMHYFHFSAAISKCLIKAIAGLWSKIIQTVVHTHIYMNTFTGRNSTRLIDRRSAVATAAIEITTALALVLARTQLIRGEATSRNVKLVIVREARVNRLRLPTRANKYCSTATKSGWTSDLS